MVSVEDQVANLKLLMESRAAAHEDATVKLQTRMDLAEQKAAEDNKAMSKIHKDQGDIIRELREQVKRTETYSKVLEEKMGSKSINDENTPDWKKRFDKDVRPRELKEGGESFTEWRHSAERWIGTGYKRLRKALGLVE